MVLPTPELFGIPEFARILEGVVERYGITMHFTSEVVEVNPDHREAIVCDLNDDTKESLPYDVMHMVPPQTAPDWISTGPLAHPTAPGGYVDVDKHTLQHVRHPEVFALGDVANTPNAKTGAAVRRQAPVVVENVRAVLAGRTPSAQYHGYASCPLTTARDRILLAEFDYNLRSAPSVPLLDTKREHRDFGLLKRVGLPTLYWNFLLTGIA